MHPKTNQRINIGVLIDLFELMRLLKHFLTCS